MNTRISLGRSPLNFFALVFVLSLPFWLVGAFTGHVSRMLPINVPTSALMFVCPALASLLLVRNEHRSEGVKALLTRAVDYTRISDRRWFLPIILIMPMVLILSYGLMRLFRMPLPEPHMPVELLAGLSLIFLASAISEEIGWSGYSIDRLQNRWGALRASIIVGTVWALWHAVPYAQAYHTFHWVLWECLATIAKRILIVWIYNNTGKSVFAASLFHAMINVSTFAFPNYGSGYSPLITGVILVVAAALVSVVWGSATLASNPFRCEGEGQAVRKPM